MLKYIFKKQILQIILFVLKNSNLYNKTWARKILDINKF